MPTRDDKELVRALENFAFKLCDADPNLGEGLATDSAVNTSASDFVTRKEHAVCVAEIVTRLTRSFQHQLQRQRLWAKQATDRASTHHPSVLGSARLSTSVRSVQRELPARSSDQVLDTAFSSGRSLPTGLVFERQQKDEVASEVPVTFGQLSEPFLSPPGIGTSEPLGYVEDKLKKIQAIDSSVDFKRLGEVFQPSPPPPHEGFNRGTLTNEPHSEASKTFPRRKDDFPRSSTFLKPIGERRHVVPPSVPQKDKALSVNSSGPKAFEDSETHIHQNTPQLISTAERLEPAKALFIPSPQAAAKRSQSFQTCPSDRESGREEAPAEGGRMLRLDTAPLVDGMCEDNNNTHTNDNNAPPEKASPHTDASARPSLEQSSPNGLDAKVSNETGMAHETEHATVRIASFSSQRPKCDPVAASTDVVPNFGTSANVSGSLPHKSNVDPARKEENVENTVVPTNLVVGKTQSLAKANRADEFDDSIATLTSIVNPIPIPSAVLRKAPCYSIDASVLRAQLEREKVVSDGDDVAKMLEAKLSTLYRLQEEMASIGDFEAEWRRQIAERQVRLNEFLMEKREIRHLLNDIRLAFHFARQGHGVSEEMAQTTAVRQDGKVERIQQMREAIMQEFALDERSDGKSSKSTIATAFQSVSQGDGGDTAVKDSPKRGYGPSRAISTVSSASNGQGSTATATQLSPRGREMAKRYEPSTMVEGRSRAGNGNGNTDNFPSPRQYLQRRSVAFDSLGFNGSVHGGTGSSGVSMKRRARPDLGHISSSGTSRRKETRAQLSLPGGELPQEDRVANAYRSALVVSDSVKRKVVAAMERYRRIGRGILASNDCNLGGLESGLGLDDEAVRVAIIRECEMELADLSRQRVRIKQTLSAAERFLFHVQGQVDALQGDDSSACQAVAEEHSDLLDKDTGRREREPSVIESLFQQKEHSNSQPSYDASGFLTIKNIIAFAHEKATGATQCDLITMDEPRPTSAAVTRFERVFKGERALIDAVKSLAVSVSHSLHLHWTLQAEGTCKACLGPFKNPITMWPCGHTLCDGCVERIPSSVSEDLLRCSECRSLCEGDPTPHVVIANMIAVQNTLPFPIEDHPYEVGMYHAILEMLSLTGDGEANHWK